MKKSLIVLLFGVPCWAQSYPAAIGWPSSYIRYNDKSGGLYARGDTWHFTAYTAAGNRFGVYADGSIGGANSCNIGIVKLAAYDGVSADGASIQVWNDPTFCDNTLGYGSESNSGTAGTGCSAGTPCSNKPHAPFCIAGHCYLNVFRQQAGIPYNAFDSTLIRSDDLDSSPPHWCNPATLAANSGTCPANITTKAGDLPNWSTGSGVMFVNQPQFSRLKPILPANYQDDGAHCPTIAGSSNYVYFVTESGDFLNSYALRVTCANLPNLNASQWETWNGSAWTGALASAAPVLALSTLNPAVGGSGCGAGYRGTEGAGSSSAVTYLPALNRYVMLGQFYDSCQATNKQHLRISQAPSLLGPWTNGIESTVSPDYYQNGTNPSGLALGSALTAGATTLTMGSLPNSGSGTYNANREPPFPFTIQVDSETMRVTAASGTAWTVVRGYAGTAAAAHNSGAAVISSYHLHPGIVSFMAGTYNEVTSDHVTIDLAFEGDEYEANSNGSKANDVYGLYFLKLHFQKAAPQNGANLLGNGPLRFSMSPIGAKKALPRKGLVSLYDFFQHNGNVNYPISQPADLITSDKCTPGQTFGPNRSNWVVGGYAFNSSDGYQPRLVSGSNHPLTGDGGWTEFVVFNPTAVGQSNIVRHGCFAQGQATMLYMGLPSAGAISYEGSNGGARSAGGVVSAGNWYVFAVTKSPGPINTTAKLYLNGASVAIGTAATNTPNVSAGPLQFGTNGNTTVSGCGGCSCNYQDGFSGTVAGYGAYNRVLNPTEIKQVCNALKSYYGRPPRNITLTCN